jgi:hypothetical protein
MSAKSVRAPLDLPDRLLELDEGRWLAPRVVGVDTGSQVGS